MDLSFEDVERMAEDFSNENVNDEEKPKKKRSERIGFKLIKVLGKVSDKKSAPVLAIVDWGGHISYDLRKWNEDMTIPYKGITLSEEEIQLLLNSRIEDIMKEKEPMAIYKAGKAAAKIYECVATLSTNTSQKDTWNKQILIVDWGYGRKVDLRKWTESFDKCSKGICLTLDEFNKIIELIRK